MGTGKDWPDPLSEDAFYGLAGEIVRAIEPHTEADPAALLLQLLVAFGNVIGRGPHYRAEADRHALNLFAVLVGETSKARKGSSWAHILNLVSSCDSGWKELCVQTGLSSGEGLIHAVRDAPDDDGDGDDTNLPDGGSMDNRLLVMEPEFASPLRMTGRDGNTLSPVVRQAWDGGQLQVMTKQAPETATNAHISIVAHVTKDELRREMTRTDAGSGFGNRFLWTCVRRSKVLPDGGRLTEAELAQLRDRLKCCRDHASTLGDRELHRTEDAKTLWHSVYPELSEGKPGLLGAVTSRGEAQVMRIACVYALLDEAAEVRPEHLKAGLAVWKYCYESARYIFGGSLGDPIAEALLTRLRATPEGLTRTELSATLGRNRSATEMNQALSFLAEQGLATAQAEETQGRSAQRWFAVDRSAA